MNTKSNETHSSGPRVLPIALGLAGAAVAVSTVALLDKNRRKKVGKLLRSVKDKGEHLTEQALGKIDDVNRSVGHMKRALKTTRQSARSLAR